MRIAIYHREMPPHYPRLAAEADRKLTEMRARASEPGCEIAQVYRVHPKAEAATRRDILRDAKNKRFDVLMLWSLSEWLTDGTLQPLVDLGQIAKKVGFFTWSDNSVGIKSAVTFEAIEAAEIERRRFNIRAAMEVARNQGKTPGAHRRDLDEKKLRKLFAAGWSGREIARHLNVPEPTVRRRIKLLQLREEK